MTKTLLAMSAALAVLWAVRVSAQEHHDAVAPGHDSLKGAAMQTHSGAGGHADAAGHDEGPVPPHEKSPVWAGVMLIVILALFVMAAVIGPVARAHAPVMEMPPTHSHDEPPGASHHHGASGTINPEPGHGHH
jgi:hypothetical protein